jgi:hypothetical protein
MNGNINMKRCIRTFLGIVIILGVSTRAAFALYPDEQPIGLFSKVILDVTHKVPDSTWQMATRGQTLGSGDMIKTGLRSFAVIKFKDNSLVRVREQSEVTVTGILQEKRFSKSVDIRNGGVGFNVTKQRTEEEFRFSSPTSVASIRGTGGVFIRGEFDTLTVIDGAVLIRNTVSSDTATVQAGYTALSGPDGSLRVRASTREEKRSAEDATRSGDQPRQLKLQLRNSKGEEEELILDYKE